MKQSDDLLPTFLEEARENIEKSHDAIELMTHSRNRTQLVNDLARYIHTIKGGCGMFDMNDVKHFAHDLENYLQQFKENPENIDEKVIVKVKMDVDKLEDLLFKESEPDGNNATQPQRESNDFLRIPLSLVNESLNNIWEIFLVRNQITYMISKAKTGEMTLGDLIQEWDLQDASLRRNVSELENKLMAMRMTNLKSLYSRMNKIVRSYANQHDDKAIELITKGEHVEVDKKVSDMLSEPFVHLIRNAIDHGLETIDERLAAGKTKTGKVVIESETTADRVILYIRDDGRGIDTKKIAEKAFSKGLISSIDIDKATALNIIFEPGFSTASEVTDVSGRGVGMDSVRTSIAEIGGEITMESELGKGTTFIISLPISLSVISSLIFEVSGQILGTNISDVAEVIYCDFEDIKVHKNEEFFMFRDQFIPCYSLKNILSDYSSTSKSLCEEEIKLVIIKCKESFMALKIDKIMGSQEIIVKSLPSLLPREIYIDGMSILATGMPIFIISLNKLIDELHRKKIGTISYDAA